MEPSDRYWLAVIGMCMIFAFSIGFLIFSNAEKKREFDLEAVKAGASIERYDMNGHVNERIETNKVQQSP